MSLTTWRNEASNIVTNNTDEYSVCFKLALINALFLNVVL